MKSRIQLWMVKHLTGTNVLDCNGSGMVQDTGGMGEETTDGTYQSMLGRRAVNEGVSPLVVDKFARESKYSVGAWIPELNGRARNWVGETDPWSGTRIWPNPPEAGDMSLAGYEVEIPTHSPECEGGGGLAGK